MLMRRWRGMHGMALASGLLLVAGAAGMAVAASSGSGSQVAKVTLSYTCQFPSGPQPVSVQVTASFPAAVPSGQPITPGGLRLTALLPQAAVADLTKLGASTTGDSAALTVSEASSAGTGDVQALWPVTTAGQVSLPSSGALTLASTGTATAVTATAPGSVSFTAAGLALMLSPRTADGAATSPATVTVACTPASAATAHLATVQVAKASPSASPSKSPVSAPAKKKTKFPPGCGHIKVIGSGAATCGYLTGYSDVLKLYGAALLQPKRPAKPVLVNLDFAERHKFVNGKLVAYSTAQLYFHGKHELPPVTATFLALRFVPVTATLSLIERSPVRIVSVSGITAPPFPITVKATTTLSIKVSNVKVNGVPLQVGPNCGTVRPVKLTLTGKGDNTLPPKGYTVPTGGPLTGTLTIPPFRGCGVTENLDQLFTGTISGPGNFVKMTQGKLCGPAQPQNWTCPPPVPKPKR